MENILLTLVIILLVILIIVLIGAVLFALKLLPKLQEKTTPDKFHPEIKKRMTESQKIKEKLILEANCHLHPNEPSEAACAICDDYFCKTCIKTYENKHFCKEHSGFFLNFKWKDVYTLKSTPNDPEAGVRVVEWKKEIWKKEAIPLYIQTHYKIDVDGDEIESWVVLFAKEADSEDIKRRLTQELDQP
ncbi:MAG: hypothetical protein LW878_06530 [Proteobacteria bacterium]|jgi:hypothetical protein|nr:hypothetical protein [Pseudomonadota bacterium]